MKYKGFAHVLYLTTLLVLITLSLSAFFWTCFQPPAEQPKEQVIPVTMAVQAQPPVVPVQTVVLPKPKPAEIVEPEKESSLPLPKHLLTLPQLTSYSFLDSVEEPPAAPIENIAAPEITVPKPPVFAGMAKIAAFVPDPPYMFEPMVLTEEEYNMFYPAATQTASEQDFWSDFFVVGQDALVAFDDGFYYLALNVNGEYVGDIEVEFKGESRLLNSDELSQFIGSFITPAANQRIFGDKLSSLSLEQLNLRNVEAIYDSQAFSISLTFNLDDMPERTVSISTSTINRREQFGMSGAIQLQPAKFAIATSLSLYTLLGYPYDFSTLTDTMMNLSISNRASLLGLGFNFYYSISSTAPYFNPGTWNGFYDFVESSHRLGFGNVGTNLNTAAIGTSTNFGFVFEKNYAYGTGKAKGNQFEYRVVLNEPSKVEIVINGNTVFSKSFQAGTYRLRDFVFTQGANLVKIITTPDARPSEQTVEYVDMGYDYRLLGKGETLYGFGLTVPSVKSSSASGSINVPWFNSQYLSYHLDKFTATYWQQIGLTDTFSFTSDVAITPGVFSGTFNGVFASMLGTTQMQTTLGLDESKLTPSFSASLSHRLSGKQGGAFGTLSSTLNVTIPAQTSTSGFSSTAGLLMSYSGNLTDKTKFTLSANVLKASTNTYPSWALSFSTGFSPFPRFSLSGSISANGSNSSPLSPTISAQISGSYSFSPRLSASSTSSTSVQTGSAYAGVVNSNSMGISYRPSQNDSMSLSLSSFKFNDPLNNSLVASYSHSGELFSFSVRQQVSNSYQDMSTTLTANTSIAYADGAFAIAKAVNESFLLIKPKGELKNSDISIARSLDASPTHLSRPLGSILYNGLSSNAKNSVAVFASGLTEYSTGSSFVFEMQPRSRQSFVARLDVDPTFTVSGLLYMTDQSPYVQYSSPVYRISSDANGQETMTKMESLYLFTDQDGRFILSEVKPGTYAFDLQVADHWYEVRFIVPVIPADKLGLDRVLLLEDFWVANPEFKNRIVVQDLQTGAQAAETQDVFGTTLATGYDAVVNLAVVQRIDDETFWTLIFPPFNENDWNFQALDNSFVTQDSYAFDASTWDALVGNSAPDPTATQMVTAAP